MAVFEPVVAPHAEALYLHSRCGHTAWLTGDAVRRLQRGRLVTAPLPEDRIRATYLLDLLDAVAETLPPEARLGPYVDPAGCPPSPGARFQFATAPPPRRWDRETCGARVDPPDQPTD